jgi:hypothetical protein
LGGELMGEGVSERPRANIGEITLALLPETDLDEEDDVDDGDAEDADREGNSISGDWTFVCLGNGERLRAATSLLPDSASCEEVVTGAWVSEGTVDVEELPRRRRNRPRLMRLTRARGDACTEDVRASAARCAVWLHVWHTQGHATHAHHFPLERHVPKSSMRITSRRGTQRIMWMRRMRKPALLTNSTSRSTRVKGSSSLMYSTSGTKPAMEITSSAPSSVT